MKKRLMTLLTITLMAVTAAGCGQKKDTEDDFENMTEEEFIDALDSMDEDELDALFEEALGDEDTAEDTEAEIVEDLYITSLFQLTEDDWNQVTEVANEILEKELLSTSSSTLRKKCIFI